MKVYIGFSDYGYGERSMPEVVFVDKEKIISWVSENGDRSYHDLELDDKEIDFYQSGGF